MAAIRRWTALVAIGVISFGFLAPASAELIFASGDTNIVNPLAGTSGAPVDVGNQQFFTNILQGGTSVVVLDCACAGGGTVGSADSEINAFYNTLGGVTSTLVAGDVTPAVLTGADLFVAPLPDDAFAASEITALTSFLTAGGTIFFLGENSAPVFTAANAAINAALSGLGSGISIVPDAFDAGFNTASGSQIAADPFTAGVLRFTYAAPSRVSDGTQIFFGTDGQPFVAYESVGERVPEPSTLLLLVSGLAGLGTAAWRTRRAYRSSDASPVNS